MSDRSNGFADNFWGTICRAIKDFLNAFDVSAMALVGALTFFTMAMATVEIFGPAAWVTPEWWWGPSGIFFLVVVTLMGKHTLGYYISSKLNSPQGQPPVVSDTGVAKPAGG